MWDYTEKVKDYFFNPKNAGVLEEANAVGEVGALSCGDALKLMLHIDPVTEIILDARFQTFGCGSAIASSSALTELVIGRTIEEALAITSRDIAEFLGGLPPEKLHCSVLGYEAVQAAIANFRGEVWKNDHEESALVCKCLGIEESVIERAIKANKLTSVEQITAYTKAGGGCTTCLDKLEDILARVNAELVADGALAAPGADRSVASEASNPRPVAKAAPATASAPAAGASRPVNLFAAPRPAAGSRPAAARPAVSDTSPLAPASPLPPPSAGLTNLKKIRLIEETIEDLRVYLRKDGGDCELIDVDGSNVLVSLTGACVGCQMASVTVSGIQERLIAKLGIPVRVIPVGRNGH
ncbi:MAG: Fe-S cluster assembly protein NifU [Methylocystaceae bacterium]|nr:MAG: Fe-S cluster assembly protein NifU [Methylocystaceae bacterium]